MKAFYTRKTDLEYEKIPRTVGSGNLLFYSGRPCIGMPHILFVSLFIAGVTSRQMKKPIIRLKTSDEISAGIK